MTKDTTSRSAGTPAPNDGAPNVSRAASAGTAQQGQTLSDCYSIPQMSGTMQIDNISPPPRRFTDASFRSRRFVFGDGQLTSADTDCGRAAVSIKRDRSSSAVGNRHTGRFCWHGDGNGGLVGTYEEDITAAVRGQVTGSGTWYLRGGTGKFADLTGSGTFRWTATSVAKVEVTWSVDFIRREL